MINKLKNTIFVSVVVLFVLCLIMPQIIFSDTVVSTVTDKNVKRYSNGDQYMIYTIDDEGRSHVFKDTDYLPLLKFNSSDIYAEIQIGETYKFSVRGIRIPILSSYQNIYKIEKEE